MVKEDIVTSLKNAIDRGESLQSAINVMINSGYNSKDVQEASKFVGGAIQNLQPKSEEHLTMPNQKNILPKVFKKTPTQKPAPIQKPIQKTQPPTQKLQQTSQTKPSQSLVGELNKIKPPKKGWLKEIILLIILLLLIGVLATLIFFRDTILSWFA